MPHSLREERRFGTFYKVGGLGSPQLFLLDCVKQKYMAIPNVSLSAMLIFASFVKDYCRAA